MQGTTGVWEHRRLAELHRYWVHLPHVFECSDESSFSTESLILSESSSVITTTAVASEHGLIKEQLPSEAASLYPWSLS